MPKPSDKILITREEILEICDLCFSFGRENDKKRLKNIKYLYEKTKKE